jgi:hypothetical protein
MREEGEGRVWGEKRWMGKQGCGEERLRLSLVGVMGGFEVEGKTGGEEEKRVRLSLVMVEGARGVGEERWWGQQGCGGKESGT